MKQIAIFSIKNDIHALAIQKAFGRYKDVKCHFIETNNLSGGNTKISLNLSNENDSVSWINNNSGERIDIKELDLIWWRRVNYPQSTSKEISDLAYIDLINNDCRFALFGITFNEFTGTWINNPYLTQLAENKIIQQKIAKNAGFNIPETLISQDPYEIRKFCEKFENNVIVKPIKGTHKYQLLTAKIRKEHLIDDFCLLLSPAIYQEYIPGNLHIRVNCFGDKIYASSIKSEELDWRQNLDVPFNKVDLDDNIKENIYKVIKALGLKMGIIDLKINRDNYPIWLEINPQGQFLFIEGLSNLDLTTPFTDFLYNEAAYQK